MPPSLLFEQAKSAISEHNASCNQLNSDKCVLRNFTCVILSRGPDIACKDTKAIHDVNKTETDGEEVNPSKSASAASSFSLLLRRIELTYIIKYNTLVPYGLNRW